MWPQRRRLYAFGVVLAPAVGALAALLLPSRLGAAVQHVATDHAPGEAITVLAVLLAVVLSADVISTLATGAYVALGTAAMRERVAAAALDRPQTNRTADLVTRILVDARQPSALLPLISSVTLAAANALAALVLLARVDWTLLVGVVAGLIAIVFLLRRLVSDTSTLLQRDRSAQARVAQRLLDAQSGAVSIRAYGTWRREVASILRAQPDVNAAGTQLWTTQARFAWRSALVIPLLLLVTVAVGGWSLAHGRIDVAGYLAAIGYTYLVLGGLDGIEAAAGLGAVRAARSRLSEFLTARPSASTAKRPKRRTVRPLTVRLRDVSVIAPDGTPRLADMNVDIAAGEFVAITGPAGSGRSTLAAVIAGLTVPTSGEALVGGRPAHVVDANGARPAVLGHARPAMLGGDIAGLICVGGRPSESTAHGAAQQAHLLDVVTALPDGFATAIRDLPLSGGELQRLAIAQAVARESGLLVLDDVTAALDPATEREVISALLGLRGRRTLVVVTNRDAVIARADKVIRLQAGRLAEPIGVAA
jgi:ATP-binding cassette subfamily B protein